MPCCLLIILAFFIPRVSIIVLWLFTHWFNGIFHTAIWPVLGFFFLPLTLLWYSAVYNWWGGHWGAAQVAGLVIAILLDLSPHGGTQHRRIRRRVVEEEVV